MNTVNVLIIGLKKNETITIASKTQNVIPFNKHISTGNN